MKIEDLKLTITRIEDGTDKDGNVFLKCKGYNAYRQGKNNAYNFFSSIKLYPINQQQLDETKNRLFSQTVDKPKLKINAYQCELATPLMGGRVFASLTAYRFDFATKKLFKKNELLNYGKGE